MVALLRSTATRCLKHGFTHGLLSGMVIAPLLLPLPLLANNLSGAIMTDYVSSPILTVRSATPQVMFVLGKDHQYWLKAYNDYTDLTGDGVLDTTYNDAFRYYGYFDPTKCYSYEQQGFPGAGQVQLFVPKAFMSNPDVNHYCDNVAGEWSGNFLNWASMTRMDIVRRMLFGGKRRQDHRNFTILERAFLPPDAHAFAKYYNGNDIHRLTPFATPVSDNPFNQGITICNVSSIPNSGNSHSINLQNHPPMIRVARGNYSLWDANERRQCRWSQEQTNAFQPTGLGFGSNGNYSTNDYNPATDWVTGPPSSGIFAWNDNPSSTTRGLTVGSFGPNYNVYIQACVSGLINSENRENCRQYPDGNYKPVGLIQRYGEDELIHFGLMMGSYEKNITGGVLRKNTGNLGDEINVETDGTLKADPNSAVPSVGMTRALDMIRLHGYRFSDGVYNYTKDGCQSTFFQCPTLTEADQGKWASWGNPISEIYMEAIRYFGGLSPTPAFAANDNNFVGGLAEDTWQDPISDDNYCAATDVIVFNSSVSSFDQAHTGGFTDLGAPHPSSLTDAIGASGIENIHGNEWFIGRTPNSVGELDDQLCTGKVIDSLGNVRGTCPEGPTQQGGFQIAGMAHWAKTNDIRPDIQGTQTVHTYAIQLATANPVIEALLNPNEPETSERVTILPAYRLPANNTAGTLVDFKVVLPQTEVNPDTGNIDCNVGVGDINSGVGGSCNRGTEPGEPQAGTGVYDALYYINWEDSEFGGDYDMDTFGLLAYRLDTTTSPATITITTNAIAAAGARGQLFGFITSGTGDKDGFHAYSGVYGGEFGTGSNTPGGRTDPTGVPGCFNCRAETSEAFGGAAAGTGQSGPQSHTFTVGGSSAGLLENPLYYAAKWGGFEDLNDSGTPDQQEEWDTTGDGVPDNYFFVTDPSKLEDALRRIFDAILERVSSGTAAAVVANEQDGTGAVFQALFDPLRTDQNDREVKWFGTLQSLFIDTRGLIREGNNVPLGSSQQLGNYIENPVVEIFFDDSDQVTKVRRFTNNPDTPDEFDPVGSTIVPLEQLRTVWNARDWLAHFSNTAVASNRNYGSSAANGRYIFTWLDSNFNGVVNNNEVVPFEPGSFNNGNFGWLDKRSLQATQDLVSWIRGDDSIDVIAEGTDHERPTRNRTLDYKGDGNARVMRLGDIVNSSPVAVSAPAEAFDLLSGDSSYAQFRSRYAQRRQVVYVGSNGGKVHAFNAGFFNPNTLSFDLTRNAVSGETSAPTAHPLGSELWAYVPKNLLGHLQWLPREDYEHVYYVDGEPRVFDARIFEPSDTHVNGWGTVLVIGFRLGGGTDTTGINLFPDGDNQNGDTYKTKSAYVVMDITDPEQPPRVLAELTPEHLQFTTSRPAVALIGGPNADLEEDGANNWYLVFGSGPNLLGTVTSSQRARLYAYDLRSIVAGNVDPHVWDLGADGENQFVGAPVVADFDIDMKAEALYFGTVGGVTGNSGKLWRLGINEQPNLTGSDSWDAAPQVLLNANQPFYAQPSLVLDRSRRPWIIAGTGRIFSNPDKESTTQQTLYGVIDPVLDNRPFPTPGSLLNVTNYQVFTNGKVDPTGTGNANSDMEFFELEQEVLDHGGWRRHYNPGVPDPSQRNVTRSSVIGGILFNTTFTPALDLCGAEGTSTLLGLAFNTGTAVPFSVFQPDPEGCPTCPDGIMEAVSEVSLGFGLASTPSIHVGKPGEGAVPGSITVVVQKSTGETQTVEAQTGGGMLSGEISWREFID